MKHLSIWLTALAPLSIRADHAKGGVEATRYIPGTTFMGSLAAVHRLMHPGRTATFERLFLSGAISYPNLYPAATKEETSEKALQASALAHLAVAPLPKTAQTCKRHPGFLPVKPLDNDAHGVRDSLVDWTIFRLSQEALAIRNERASTLQPLQAFDSLKQCRHKSCMELMDRFSGYYRRDTQSPQTLLSTYGATQLQIHTGINRDSGTVQDRILYNRLVFSEDTPFWGEMLLPDDDKLISLFSDFIHEVGTAGLVHVGTGRTRGMGKVAIKHELVDSMSTQRHAQAFDDRLDTFNRKIAQKIADFKLHEFKNSYFFAITLHSPAILCDELLRYRGSIDGAVLTELLHTNTPGLDIPDLKQIYQVASVKRLTGWQDLWGMPRINEYAIESGSVFLFRSSVRPDQAVFKALHQLEEQGIGKRRSEGFGRICISDQFHQEVTQR